MEREREKENLIKNVKDLLDIKDLDIEDIKKEVILTLYPLVMQKVFLILDIKELVYQIHLIYLLDTHQ